MAQANARQRVRLVDQWRSLLQRATAEEPLVAKGTQVGKRVGTQAGTQVGSRLLSEDQEMPSGRRRRKDRTPLEGVPPSSSSSISASSSSTWSILAEDEIASSKAFEPFGRLASRALASASFEQQMAMHWPSLTTDPSDPTAWDDKCSSVRRHLFTHTHLK